MAVESLLAPKQNPTAKIPGADKLPQDQPQPVGAPGGLASILIPCCGQIEFTRLCVPSLLRYTRQPFELIFLDIGSLDGTYEFLTGIAAACQVRVEIIRTRTDLGVSQAVQDALKQARGEYLVLLNNDTVVTENWLHSLIALAQLSPETGLVGPMSNYATPPQLVEKVPYRIGPKKNPRVPAGSGLGSYLVDVSAVDAFARKFREENRGKWTECDRLGGFCLLVKREVLKRTGHVQETSELGVFDAEKLCVRARQGGFKLALCRDLFVHHFGTRTIAHAASKSESEKANARA
jgi:GT2 family glycosyltransferase